MKKLKGTAENMFSGVNSEVLKSLLLDLSSRDLNKGKEKAKNSANLVILNTSERKASLSENLELKVKEILESHVLRERFLEKFTKSDGHDVLTEKIPTILINQEVTALGNGFYAGKLYNPGKTPNLEKMGLALSQIGVYGLLKEAGMEAGTERKKTPMVTKISKLILRPDADENFENLEDLDLEVQFSEDKKSMKGVVKLGNLVLCEAEMQLGFVPLMPKIIDRIRKKSKNIEWNDSSGEKLPDLQMPGFADKFTITNRRRTENSDFGEITVSEGLFQGHFPQIDIIPIAGSAKPGFWLAANRIIDSEGNLMEVSRIENLNIPAPLLPGDKLFYKITEIPEEENCVSIEILYDFDGEKKQAVFFEKVWLTPAKRKNNLWSNDNVVEAFKNQDQIPQYPEHVNQIVETTVQSILEVSETGNINITDIGTGSGRIMKSILDHKGIEPRKSDMEISLTDVAPKALENARSTIEKKILRKFSLTSFFQKGSQISCYLIKKVGEIIPETLPSQNIIVGNFSFYGDLNKSFKDAYEKLEDNGVLILGLPHENPNYNNLMLAESERLKDDFQINEYKNDLIMSDIGIDLCEDSLTHRKNCQYLPIESVKVILEEIGFKVEIIDESSFCGIGYIIKAYKQ